MHRSLAHHLMELLKLLGASALYLLLARLALVYSHVDFIAVIWPASGLALTALLLGGKRYAWSVFFGAFLSNVIADNSFLASVVLALGSTFEAFFGAWLLGRDGKFDLHLRSLRDYLRLILLAGGFASIIAALVAATTLLFSGFLTAENYFNSLIHWWMGDTLGIILIAPLILVWGGQRVRLDMKQVPEAILVIGVTFLAGQIVFLDWFHDSIGHLVKGYLMFLFITWAAVRLETRGTVVVLIMTAAQALSGAYYGVGYFGNDIAATQLTNYWSYMVILSVVGMALATYFTEHKAAEAKINRMTQLYAALSQCNQAIVRCTNEQELFLQICRDAVQFGGMKMAWIGLIDSDTSRVQSVASFGDGTEYLQNIEISADADSPFGHGPVGTAARDNQPFWCQDFMSNPATAPWHERGARFGWGAAASLPLHRNGAVIGVFTLYAGEANAFDEAARNLLVEMATDISYALNNFVREAGRKQMEQALRESEQQLRTIIETEPECVKLIDRDGRLLKMNAAGLAMLEADSVAEVQQHTLISFILPEYRASFTALNKRVMSGESGIVDFEVMGLKGTRRWLETHATPMLDVNGEVEMLLSVTRDITERKRTEAQLKLAAKVFEQSNEGFFITDVDANIVMVNHAFTVISGYTEAEVIGQNPRILSSGRHDQEFYRAMWDQLNTEGFWQGEIWNRRKNNQVYPELLSISSVRDVSGQITNYIAVFADISAIKESEAQLEFLAHHDPLTALPNRLLSFHRLEHGIDVARRDHKQLALLMLDLDRFKDINDSFGHLAGDQLLQQVAERLTGRLREVDTVARLGGDEFTVLLEDIAHQEDAARVAKEIIDDLSEPWLLPHCGEVKIGVSIGISLYPQHGDTPETLLQQADTALYLAKAQGRGRYAYFTDELTLAARERMELEARLRRAIAQNELRIYYQPQVDIESGRIVGAEALVRWQDPVEGLIQPCRFIPMAEETGLILAVGEWVLRETCRQGRQWLDAGLPPLTLAVNVSPYQFSQSDMSGLLAIVLAETAFPANCLELELTESGLMEKEEESVAILNSLRAQGVRLAIDDFGTGYSSLAYLKRFPLDVLKIDKSFIDDIPHKQDDMEIAATIVAMGHTLGFKVLAEGVETVEQLDFLQQQGCDLYQGYLNSHPLSAEDFDELLREECFDSST
ncbi:MAG: EAL domain-containing protein [Methylobacter sp.]|jgi:diguanylate cyclase (GGDEF)-like protein/PAS domain S-box-containing protein